MREIKFRFWLAEDRKMYKVLDLSGKFPDEEFHRAFINRDKDGDGVPLNYRSEKGNALMQWTGKNDNDGTEVYEDDTIAGSAIDDTGIKHGISGDVVWDEDLLCWMVEGDDSIMLGALTELKVTGNIWQNP